MERQFQDALDDLVCSLEEIVAQARVLSVEIGDPGLAARAITVHAQCERALVDSKKLAHLSSSLLHREAALRLVSRRR
jgi:hypothetical protein